MGDHRSDLCECRNPRSDHGPCHEHGSCCHNCSCLAFTRPEDPADAFDRGWKHGEVEGLKNAMAIIGDLEARTVGTGSMRDLMVAAYREAQRAILIKVALAEAAALNKGKDPLGHEPLEDDVVATHDEGCPLDGYEKTVDVEALREWATEPNSDPQGNGAKT